MVIEIFLYIYLIKDIHYILSLILGIKIFLAQENRFLEKEKVYKYLGTSGIEKMGKWNGILDL